MCLPALKHEWKRFVIPSGTTALLESEFLPDPDDEYAIYHNPTAQAFSSLRERTLVVLLGDSGLGKSDVFAQEAAAINGEHDADHTAVLCRVSDYVDTLQIDSFFSSAPFQRWLAGTGTLSLFIDGIDEGLLRGDSWPTSIRLQLERWRASGQLDETEDAPNVVLNRLRLRISCRPGLWPASLTESLQGLYPRLDQDADYITQWHLLPLREVDVRIAAVEHGLDADRFMQDVAAAGAFSFAASPLSLRLLFQIEAAEQSLPRTHVSMFQKGCTYLTEEHNVLRRESALRPRVAVQRRLAVARRIAAMSVFCAKTRVSRTAAAIPADDASILNPSEIRGSASQEDITPEELAETLDSGLFTIHDNQTVRWAHASFSAFLAAEWCKSLDLTAKELYRFVTAVTGGLVGIPDQVVSTAAWLCELEPPLQRLLIRDSPQLLLSLDSNAIDMKSKPLAVDALVKQDAPLQVSRELMRTGVQLRYPDIAKQLRPYLTSRRKFPIERKRRALDIATSCRLQELSTELSQLALDPDEDRSLRSSAAYAISAFGSTEARRALLRLASEAETIDNNQDLKGWALTANWPGGLSARQLFALFTDKTNPHFHGGYEAFLYKFSSDLADTLTDDDLIPALEWAEALPVFEHNLTFDRIAYNVVIRACNSYEVDAIRRGLAELLVSRARRHGDPVPRQATTRGAVRWETKLAESPGLRESLIQECFRAADDGDRAALYRIGWFLRLSADDLPLLNALMRADPDTFSQPVGQVLVMLGHDPAVYEAIYRGVAEGLLNPDLLVNLRVELGSITAEMQKEEFERPLLVEAGKVRRLQEGWYSFSQGLQLTRDGNNHGWMYIWEALWELNPDKDSRWEGSPDLTSAAGWSQLDEVFQRQIADVACDFALSYNRLPTDFLNGGPFSRSVVYVYSALLLCVSSHDARLDGIDDETWTLWTIIAFWFPFGQKDPEWQQLITWLAKGREEAFFAGVQRYVDASLDAQQGISYSVRRYHNWPARTELMICQALKRTNLSADQWAALIEWGLDVNASLFGNVLLRRLHSASRSDYTEQDVLVQAAVLFVRYGKDDPWTELEDIFMSLPSVGAEVIGAVQEDSRQAAFLSRMSDRSLALFYVWLRRNIGAPGSNMPRSGAVGPGFHRQMIVERTFGLMLERGNLAVFDYIASLFPEDRWMRWHRATVKQIVACPIFCTSGIVSVAQ